MCNDPVNIIIFIKIDFWSPIREVWEFKERIFSLHGVIKNGHGKTGFLMDPGRTCKTRMRKGHSKQANMPK